MSKDQYMTLVCSISEDSITRVGHRKYEDWGSQAMRNPADLHMHMHMDIHMDLHMQMDMDMDMQMDMDMDMHGLGAIT